MHPEPAGFPHTAPPERARRKLHAFVLASLAAHAVVIVGFPDFLPRFAAPGASVLEVTILGPQPLPVAPPQAESREPPPTEEPRPVERRPEPERKPTPQETAKPAPGGQAPGVAAQSQDTEIVGSFSVAPSRGLAPLGAVPDPAAEAAAQKVTPPSFDAAYLSNPAPQYPPAARRAGQQGTVTLRVMVRRDGLPTRVEIEKSSGSGLLDTAAQDAVWGWRFVPARLGTDPIESWVLVPVVFRLEG
jgi:protein TonB